MARRVDRKKGAHVTGVLLSSVSTILGVSGRFQLSDQVVDRYYLAPQLFPGYFVVAGYLEKNGIKAALNGGEGQPATLRRCSGNHEAAVRTNAAAISFSVLRL